MGCKNSPKGKVCACRTLCFLQFHVMALESVEPFATQRRATEFIKNYLKSLLYIKLFFSYFLPLIFQFNHNIYNYKTDGISL